MEQRVLRKRRAKLMSNIIWIALSAVLVAPCSSAEAQQQPDKIHRVGYLSSVDSVTDSVRVELFRAALRELGYLEGKNIVIEYRYADGKRDRQAEIADELVRLKNEIIVISGGDVVIRAAMNATKTIPIVLTGQGPIRSGRASSKVLVVPEGMSLALPSLPQSWGKTARTAQGSCSEACPCRGSL
jgi:ABC-type uncharacterized transport system substrate-binding protein